MSLDYIICSKVGFSQSCKITKETLTSLKHISDLRKYLEQINFITSDTNECTWRFLTPNVEQSEKSQKDARILSINIESILSTEDLAATTTSHELMLTDTKKTKKPDLMGFLVDGFKGGDLEVKCTLNDSNDKSITHNKDKFQPIMLSDVCSTADNINLSFKNVCLCCKDSAIKFYMHCCGTLGFWYEVHINNEDFTLIRSSGTRWDTNIENTWGHAECYSWDGDDEQIIIKATTDVGIRPNERLHYMKLTIRAADLLSWKTHTGELFIPQSDLGKRKYEAKKQGLLINYCHPIELASKLKSENKTNKFTWCNKIVFAKSQDNNEQTGVSGSDVEPATPTKGEHQDIKYGPWWCQDTSSFEKAQDSLDIYFFVFNDLETAKRYIDHINSVALKAGTSIWGN